MSQSTDRPRRVKRSSKTFSSSTASSSHSSMKFWRDTGTKSRGFFAGCHDVIVARRHYVDGAARTDQLASSGTLTNNGGFTVDAATQMLPVLGSREALTVDVAEIPLASGDLVLLCSDGLTGELLDEEIRALIDDADTLEDALEKLIGAALWRGGRDNITAVLVRIP